jgi:oligopeptide transport system substrate-binding protein
MRKKISIFLAILMVMLLILPACSKQPAADGDKQPTENTDGENQQPAEGEDQQPAADAKTLTVCVGPDPDTIDPALNSAVDGATLILHGFEGLMTLDKNGTPVAGQAETYEVSEDKKVYTFHLRDGLKWSDGKPLTANDFVYSWNRAVNPTTAADYGYMFDVIDGYDKISEEAAAYAKAVEDATAAGTEAPVAPEYSKLNVTAPDDKTVVVTLKNDVPYFLELTAFPTYSPVRQDIIEANGEGWAVKPETYIGNGP